MNTGYRALAALLDYPSPALQDNLDEVRAALAGFGPAASSLAPLLDQLAAGDVLDLQENYVDTFDRGRRASLNLFEHVHGDSRDRGQAMVDLLAMYRAAGVELDTEQLPDYLPAFLEYLSLLDDATARQQLIDITHILQAIRAALARRASVYAPVFDVLLGLTGAVDTTQEAEPEDDTTPEAIDAAWVDAPVNFLDAPAPCRPVRPQASEQAIHIHRRSA